MADPSEAASLLDTVQFDDEGLVPAIAQDAASGQVLMLAYMNEEALRKTLDSGQMTYWSRSREALWRKGGTSGHMQQVVEARVDCDGDALLFRVEQTGGACHTGYRSCFYRRAEDGTLVPDGNRVFDPDDVYE
jgi:phosphoribosyl-AMP cyclohydrolase